MSERTKSILKYSFALILLALILRSAGVEKILGYLKQISLFHWLFAIVFATLAQLAAAFRMRFFFLSSGFALSSRYAIILYYVGSFYNFLLPGGIGGDAYKVILARKRMDIPAMQGIRIMLADRASGLCILMLIFFITVYFDDIPFIPYFQALVIAATIGTILCYMFGCKLLLKQKPWVMMASLPYSAISQSLWVATLYVIWLSIGDGHHFKDYATLYAASSIAGMVPLSVGGLGIKEIAYYYGASFMNHWADIAVDPGLGVVLSLCVFAMMFIASLPGLLWLQKVTHLKHN
jgi:uncharacterized membrane protein YbhN (UPF0104 family)